MVITIVIVVAVNKCGELNILSGFEYEEDAKDSIKNEILFGGPNAKRLKVFSCAYLELLIP